MFPIKDSNWLNVTEFILPNLKNNDRIIALLTEIVKAGFSLNYVDGDSIIQSITFDQCLANKDGFLDLVLIRRSSGSYSDRLLCCFPRNFNLMYERFLFL